MLKIRTKDGKLPFFAAVVLGLLLSFIICFALTISAPLMGQLLEGAPGPVNHGVQAEQFAQATSAMLSLWWWIVVAVFGLALTRIIYGYYSSEG